MLKSFYIFSFLLFSTSLVFAQAGFKGGLMAGFVSSDIVGMDTLDHDEDFKKAGFVAGATLNLPLSEKNSVQMELTYIQKGYYLPPLSLDSSGNSANNGYFYKLSLDYIEVPILFKHKAHFTIGKKTIDKFEWELGLSFARLVRHLEKDAFSGNIPSSNIIKDNYSAHIGLSYFFTPKFSFNIRFANSLNPIRPRSAIPASSAYLYLLNRGTNTVLAYTLRYSFL